MSYSENPSEPRMPVGIHNAYAFQVFNTISWQIVQGLPILLFFKFLGATDTVLGLAAALNPLMNMMQIPAASHVERIGYRAFVLRGWIGRTAFVGGLACIPLLLYFQDKTTCLAFTLFLLFGYSTLRGISLCAFLPWMTQLIPEKIRGTFISRDQMFSAGASLLTMIAVAFLFAGNHSQIAFTVAFGASFIAGLFSLWFLQKMPDVPTSPSSTSSGKVPWREMFLYPPFLKILIYNVVVNSAIAAASVFWVPVLRDNFHWSDSEILAQAALSTVFAMIGLWFFGKMIDRVGSRPLLTLGGVMMVIHFLLWFCLASRSIGFNPVSITFLCLTAGLGGPIFGLANARLVMATVPEMGRSHFFAMFSVITSLTLGLLPIMWGLALDAMRHFAWKIGVFELDNYSLLYLTLALTILSSFSFQRHLSESRAMTNEEFFRELLVETPNRAITRLLTKRWL